MKCFVKFVKKKQSITRVQLFIHHDNIKLDGGTLKYVTKNYCKKKPEIV